MFSPLYINVSINATLFACLEIIYRFQNGKNINGFSNTFHNLINRLVCHRCLIYGLGYKDLYATGMVGADTDEDTITVEWYLKVYNRWTSENRASQVNVNLIPTNQYPDVTVKKKRGKAPTIDFCFRAWNRDEGYFGAECKRLKSNNAKLLQEYVDNGLMRFVNGKYSLMCSESAMIGYIQEGTIKDIVDKLKVLLATNTRLEEQLLREVREENPQYKSAHNRKIDNQTITVHHLFFDFVV